MNKLPFNPLDILGSREIISIRNCPPHFTRVQIKYEHEKSKLPDNEFDLLNQYKLWIFINLKHRFYAKHGINAYDFAFEDPTEAFFFSLKFLK